MLDQDVLTGARASIPCEDAVVPCRCQPFSILGELQLFHPAPVLGLIPTGRRSECGALSCFCLSSGDRDQILRERGIDVETGESEAKEELICGQGRLFQSLSVKDVGDEDTYFFPSVARRVRSYFARPEYLLLVYFCSVGPG